MVWDKLLAFNVFSASLPLLTNIYDEKYRAEDQKLAFPDDPPDFNLPVKEVFDFVIVGGGTAGLVLARRLSDKYRVVVLEAGGDPLPLQSLVYNGESLATNPVINHQFGSIPQKNAYNRIIEATGGRLLGGSSSHNDGHYQRGSPFDYDRFAEVTGDDSWKYENVLKYFLKSENYHGQFSLENGQHARGGLLPVTSLNTSFRSDIWFSAGRELGYETLDSNGPQKVGFIPAEFNRNLTNRRRVSTYTAFIKPVEATRENLVIRRYSVASEILFEGNRAIGVEYERHKVPSVVFASKEVLVCAGAYTSPILLIRSGIGPKDQVNAAKKTPVSILPVGENVQDHWTLNLPEILVEDPSVIIHDHSTIQFQDFNSFVDHGEGPLNADGKLEAFIASNRAKYVDKNPQWTDLQIYFTSLDNIGALSCDVVLQRPYSVGKLYYNASASTLEESLIPIIDYRVFENPSDINVLIQGIKFCQRVVNTPTFKKIGARFASFEKQQSACRKKGPMGSRAFWNCYVRRTVTGDTHMVGTVRMGKPNDPQSVLDSKLRVLGVEGLRVCDASIMPYELSANIAAPIMMIAEKTSDEILKDWSSATKQIK